jgi:hypothetical protein
VSITAGAASVDAVFDGFPTEPITIWQVGSAHRHQP